jgi:hypothetical protein
MRHTLPLLRRLAALVLLAALLPSQGTLAAQKAPAPKAEQVEISGRIAVGLDKVFIKDAQGYCLVQGLNLAPYAGRHIQARGVLVGQDQEYRTVRLLDYRILSPDDDSPGAVGAAKPAGAGAKRK